MRPPLFYDALSLYYESYCESSKINISLQEEIRLVESYKPTSVLEFGIGDGRFAKAYLKRNPTCNYVGVDNSPHMLIRAKDSRAKLICEDISVYLKKILETGKRYDCIIDPYTAIYHIETSKQEELIRNMCHVSDVVLINCLSKEEEKIFGNSDELEISVVLPTTKAISTTIYKLHPDIRKRGTTLLRSGGREYLKIP